MRGIIPQNDMTKTTTKKNFIRQLDIERMAREAAKASGVMKALDQAILHGQRDAKEYGGAFDAIADMTDALHTDLTKLADEINVEKWEDK